MLTGPTPTLTNWITYRRGVEIGPCTLAIPLGEEFTVPSILPLGSITMSLYGKFPSDSATTENASAFDGTMRFCRSVWPIARALVLVVVVPGPAAAWVLALPVVTQDLSPQPAPLRALSS